MSASRPMLEALLARVRQRAAEPRQRTAASARSASAAVAAGTEAPARAIGRAVAAGDDEIEEYDEELIEIIDDGDVESEVERTASPLELSASAPSIELRRAALQPSTRPSEPGPVTARPANVPARASAPTPMMSSRGATTARPAADPAPIQPESVARKPITSANVVQALGARPTPGNGFIEALDASLELGN